MVVEWLQHFWASHVHVILSRTRWRLLLLSQPPNKNPAFPSGRSHYSLGKSHDALLMPGFLPFPQPVNWQEGCSSNWFKTRMDWLFCEVQVVNIKALSPKQPVKFVFPFHIWGTNLRHREKDMSSSQLVGGRAWIWTPICLPLTRHWKLESRPAVCFNN